ncbi:hypothetical protein KS2013_2280 [Kangiella sediminilitoris]|uniref:DUF3261 domain-containing protein n=2 Tax=Kangiella sediminilitoris TaxID=1144748 RepID=A0A1B3BDS0_9GAMM|nr:hypothetical protein KS2013_2280 [Kangiella sediminilitoris]
MVAEEVGFSLLSSVPFEDGLRLTQSATAEYNNESHDLIFQTEIRQGNLAMVGLTPTGTRLFTIILKQGEITAEGLSAIVENIKPDYLLADLQLSLWPAAEIQQALSGGKIITAPSGQRLITRNNQPIIQIEYSQQPAYEGTIRFNHLERGYSLYIEPLSIETIDQPFPENSNNDL